MREQCRRKFLFMELTMGNFVLFPCRPNYKLPDIGFCSGRPESSVVGVKTDRPTTGDPKTLLGYGSSNVDDLTEL